MIARGPEVEEFGNDDPSPATTSRVDPLQSLLSQLKQLRASATGYFAAEAELWKLMVQRWFLYLVAGVVGLMAALVVVISAIVLFLNGLAGMVSQLLGGRPWTGELSIGGAVLATMGLGAWLAISMRRASARRHVLDRYPKPKT
jgi:hypothetical protein